jgi:hypothetical protein
MRVKRISKYFPTGCWDAQSIWDDHAIKPADQAGIIGFADDGIIYFGMARRRAAAKPTKPKPASIMA